MHFTVFHFEDAGGQLVDEVAVVGYEDHRAGVVLQGREEDFLGAHVQVVGGLVEQQKIRGHHQHAGQRVAVALAAGEHRYGLEDIVFREQEAAQNAAQLGVGGARGDGGQVVDHAGVLVQLFVLVLGEVIGLGIVAQGVGARVDRFGARPGS